MMKMEVAFQNQLEDQVIDLFSFLTNIKNPIVSFQYRNIFLKPLKCSQVSQRGKILN